MNRSLPCTRWLRPLIVTCALLVLSMALGLSVSAQGQPGLLQEPIGACCIPDSDECLELTEAECLTREGVYQGDLTTCVDGLCDDPIGACCLPDGTCIETTEMGCVDAAGSYQGDDTLCVDQDCGLPEASACCLPSGDCIMASEADCAARGGAYQLDALLNPVRCEDVACEQTEVLGACCLTYGGCAQMTYEDCTAILQQYPEPVPVGIYIGDNIPCEDVSCSEIQGRGACCINGACTDLQPEYCAANGGIYKGDGTPCNDESCLNITSGACCFDDGTCMQTLNGAVCQDLGGTYQGDGVSCETANCTPAPTGACCLPGGDCATTTGAECTGMAGVYQGDDVDCSTVDCPAPGACCLPDGSCAPLYEDVCLASGGTFGGEGVACADATCVADPVGACCLPDGSCLQISEFECTARGGTNQWVEGAPCEDDMCTVVTGACCLPDGICRELSETNCEGLRGVYQGNGVDCDDVECPEVTLGACCLPSGECIQATAEACDEAGGAYEGVGTDCASADCQIVTWGACCLPDGYCSEMPAAVCAEAGGIYQADWVECPDVACEQPPTGACCTIEGICEEASEYDCRASGGEYYGDGTSCVGVDCEQPLTGACCLGEGECIQTTTEECRALLGDYRGRGTDCAVEACVALPVGACVLGTGEEGDPLSCVEATGPECVSLGGTFAGEGTDCPGELPMALSVQVTADPDLVSPGDTTNLTVLVCNDGLLPVDVVTLEHDTLGDVSGMGDCVMPRTLAVADCYECSFPATIDGAAGDTETETVCATWLDEEGNAALACGSDDVLIECNQPPVVDAGPDVTINEGDLFAQDGSFTDPDSTLWTGTVDYDDPSSVEPLALAGQSFHLEHLYGDDGSYVVAVTIDTLNGAVGGLGGKTIASRFLPASDSLSGLLRVAGLSTGPQLADAQCGETSGTDTVSVTVSNVAPTIALSGAASVDEGALYTLTLGAVTDPGDDTVTQYIIHWGDGSTDTYMVGGDVTHIYDDGPASMTITVDLVDEDGTHSGAGTLTVLVNNVAPTADLAVSPTVINEGESATLSLTNPYDPSAADTLAGFTYSFDCTDDGVFEQIGADNSLICNYAEDGPYTLRGLITDKDGDATDQSVTLLVLNVCPSVGTISIADGPYEVGDPVAASAPFTDPGVEDTHTATWDWGDGDVTSGTVSEVNGSGTASGSHAYATPGLYRVTLTVADDDGCESNVQYEYVVVIDRSGGRLTGGGWYQSQAGAYVADPTLSGKASFAVNCRYQRKSTTPVGTIEFHFQAAGIRMHTIDYEWLVVKGSRASAQGTATINGIGGYGFMISIIDARLDPAATKDLIRIKIWDEVTGGTVIYDTQMGDPDDADPTTAIKGGSIVIHK